MSNLYILTPSELLTFDHLLVIFSKMQRICFSINNLLEKEISAFRMPINKVVFFLQHVYLKACKRFSVIGGFTSEPIKQAAQLSAFSSDEVDFFSYKKKIPVIIKKRF